MPRLKSGLTSGRGEAYIFISQVDGVCKAAEPVEKGQIFHF
jgi:hypothetical protein